MKRCRIRRCCRPLSSPRCWRKKRLIPLILYSMTEWYTEIKAFLVHLFSSNQFPPSISDSESADPLIGGWLVNRALAKLFSERQPKTDRNINSFKLHWQRNLLITVRSIFLYDTIWISFLIMSNIQIIITFLMLKISPVLIFIMPLYALSTRGHCNIANNHLNNQQALAVLLSNLIIKLTDLLLFAILGEKNNDEEGGISSWYCNVTGKY